MIYLLQLVALAITFLRLVRIMISFLDYGYLTYHLNRSKLKKTYSYKKKPSKTKSPGKNKKLPNKRPDIVRKVANFVYNGHSFARRSEKLLQKIFTLVAVKASCDLNLIQ